MKEYCAWVGPASLYAVIFKSYKVDGLMLFRYSFLLVFLTITESFVLKVIHWSLCDSLYIISNPVIEQPPLCQESKWIITNVVLMVSNERLSGATGAGFKI